MSQVRVHNFSISLDGFGKRERLVRWVCPLTWAFARAGDENRTRVLSLGS